MIGTTEFEYCKEKAMGIIADWLWVLAVIIGEITGVIQGDYSIIVLVYKNIGENWQYVAFQLRGNDGKFEKLKYMKDFREKPSIYSQIGIKDYQTLEGYTPIRVYSEY